MKPDIPIPEFEPGQYVALGLGNWEPRLEGTQQEKVPEKRLSKLTRRLLISAQCWIRLANWLSEFHRLSRVLRYTCSARKFTKQ